MQRLVRAVAAGGAAAAAVASAESRSEETACTSEGTAKEGAPASA